MPENNARKQIISQIEKSESILIALNSDPSVDELAAALALTLAINKTDNKRATAVASGKMPDALEFLNPDKTFETSVDSLRDFIIALSKDKADHLKYKLVGDHVKIFITPYKSVISERDLEFSQGDFNVDFVLALGVRDKNHLDGALAAHGRIFHDASVGVITVGENPSTLSKTNWHEADASAISELILDILEQKPFDKKILNRSIATAILTGIVAETERFSNQKTTAKVMNTASKLILAGADQQLVISKLREAEEKSAPVIEAPKPAANPEAKKPKAVELGGTLKINHTGTIEELEASLKKDKSKEKQLEEDLNALKTPSINAFAELENLPTAQEISTLRTPEVAPIKVAPTVEVPQIETISAPEIIEEKSFNVPNNFEPIDLPAPLAEPTSEDFLTETPILTQEFEPAPLQEISAPQTPEIAPIEITPTAEIPQIETISTPTFENAPQTAQISDTDFIAEPIPQLQNTEVLNGQGSSRTILPLETPSNPSLTLGDDYYNPVQNQAIANSLNAQPMLSHPEPQDNFGLPPLPPMPNFDQMMPPSLPELPDFGQLPELPALPPVDFGMPMASIPAPDANPALGTSTTQQQVMTENLYPDPSQFKIPGM